MNTSPDNHDVLNYFHAPVKSWFNANFPAPTRPQLLGWPVLVQGQSVLLLSPTGSGKTLSAFLVAIDRLLFDPIPAKGKRCRILYISPLKALAVDVERNLREPLNGIQEHAMDMGIRCHRPVISMRTGDTPSKDRARFQRSPGDILITTPESLYLLLTSGARETLRSVQCVIVDEVHSIVGSKRGTHLSLSLERLEEIVDSPFQRVGLSATQRPLEEVARFLGGFEERPPSHFFEETDTNDLAQDGIAEGILADEAFNTPTPPEPRSVTVVDAGLGKTLNLHVEVPADELTRLAAQDLVEGETPGLVKTPSIWAAIHPMILRLIREHRSTLIFVNSRRLAERLTSDLNTLANETLVSAHHGSIAKEQRAVIEDDLKNGRLPALVATSSLELGIDMGAIDLVIQVGSPPRIASGMQRIGRAGHQVGASSKGIIIPQYRGDLLACAAMTAQMHAGKVEQMRYPRNPLDVLAQQITAMVAMDDWSVENIGRVIRRSAPYAELPEKLLRDVLDMLSGRYPSDAFSELRPRITWDRNRDILTSRENTRHTAVISGGSIPDRGVFGVFLVSEDRHARVGELDEEMVFESKVGDKFILGASTWRVEEITHDRVLVSPAPGQSGTMPFWHGESVGRDAEFGSAIGILSRTLIELDRARAERLLIQKNDLSQDAAALLLDYLGNQVNSGVPVPDDRTIVLESNRDEMGDWRICLLSPFGKRVHAPLGMAAAARIRDRYGIEPEVLWTDDGIVARLPDTEQAPDPRVMLPDSSEVQDLVIRQLSMGGGGAREVHLGSPVNALFASRFRESAARALLLPRRYPGRRSPLWQQRKRAADLLNVISKYGTFPIILETFREILQDVFDMPSLISLLEAIEHNNIEVVQVETRIPSPFAASLQFHYVANFIYEGDAPLSERKAQALLVDVSQLKELLGEGGIRELIDEDALREHEANMQCLTQSRAVKHADGLHDLLLHLGDLTLSEIESRAVHGSNVQALITSLVSQYRVVPVRIDDDLRYIAAEDAGRYRDALGIDLPDSIPGAYLGTVDDPLGDLISRYARTHGPFNVTELAYRFQMGIAPVLTVLKQLQSSGKVIEGHFRPGGKGVEWCNTDVLRTLRQLSLAKYRKEVAPASVDAMVRLWLSWQNIYPQNRHTDVREILTQLQDTPLLVSQLETDILPARLANYDPRDLDALTSSGEFVWIGKQSVGERDGRIAFYASGEASLLCEQSGKTEHTDRIHNQIRELLSLRGASFFTAIMQHTGGFAPNVLEALWELVWAGEVMNDTIAPLRVRLTPSAVSMRARSLSHHHRMIIRGNTHSSIPLAEAGGRWFLTSSVIRDDVSLTERSTARVQQFLNKMGVLPRTAIQNFEIEGGYTSVYTVLRAMEETGHIHRGYFVEGLGASQFGIPQAIENLRAMREPNTQPQVVLLATTDPVNPYGSVIPWPDTSVDRRPQRSAGSFVIIVDGFLAAWLARGEKDLITFFDGAGDRDPREMEEVVAKVLAEQFVSRHRRPLTLEQIDSRPASQSVFGDALLAAGFSPTYKGYVKRL